MTAVGLTFTSRSTANDGAGDYVFTYTAPYTSNFSGSIAVVMNSASYTTIAAFGIGGAATSSYFDTNASLPGVVNADQANGATISTTNANDFLMFVVGGNCTTVDSPWTTLVSADYLTVAYLIVSSPQSDIYATLSSGASPSITDAIVKAP